MHLAWDPPSYDGGAPILRYFLQGMEGIIGSGPGSGPQPLELHTRDASTSLTVRNLKPNTPYVFRIYSLNACGLSPPSASSAVMRSGPSVPGPPENLRVLRHEIDA